MDWNQIDKNWKQFKPKIKRKWRKLTADDLTNIGGQRDVLEDRIHKRYGFSTDHIRKEVDDWLRWQTLKSNSRKRTDLITESARNMLDWRRGEKSLGRVDLKPKPRRRGMPSLVPVTNSPLLSYM